MEVVGKEKDFFILRFTTFSGTNIGIPFTANYDIDGIQIQTHQGEQRGLFNPDFKIKAQKSSSWKSTLFHEAMHCLPEFTVPYYSTINVISEIEDSDKFLIKNLIEDVVINHTLWLWEVSPIRTTDNYKKTDITLELIRQWENYKLTSKHPNSISAILQFLSEAHMKFLQLIMQNKIQTQKRINIHLKNNLNREIIVPIIKNLSSLLNSRAISLPFENDSLEIILPIEHEVKSKSALFETRFQGKRVPQYVPIILDYINQIYDLLDLHFAEVYDLKVMNLRKEVYLNNKKNNKNRLKRTKSEKYIENIDLKIKGFVENNFLVFDFNINKSTNVKIPNQSPISHSKIQAESKIKNITFKRPAVKLLSDKYLQIEQSELFRLKKWVNKM